MKNLIKPIGYAMFVLLIFQFRLDYFSSRKHSMMDQFGWFAEDNYIPILLGVIGLMVGIFYKK